MEEELAALAAIYGDSIAIVAAAGNDSSSSSGGGGSSSSSSGGGGSSSSSVASGAASGVASGVAGGVAGGVTQVHVKVERGGDAGPVVVNFTLLPGYPDVLPLVEVEGLPKGGRDTTVTPLLAALPSLRGTPMLFTLVERVRDAFGEDHTAPPPASSAASTTAGAGAGAATAAAGAAAAAAARQPRARDIGVAVYHGAPLTVSKSVFVAHVARVTSRDAVAAVLAELYDEPRIARATHNIRAYRFIDAASGARVADNDDDGEDAAGGRLAHLLELMAADNVMVVVSRWFGGVLLGPARFKYINDTARLAIEAQPWYDGRGAAS